MESFKIKPEIYFGSGAVAAFGKICAAKGIYSGRPLCCKVRDAFACHRAA